MGIGSPVVLDQQFVVGRAFGAGGTPSAVLVDEEGKIASEVAVGGQEAVLELAGTRAET
jgi:sec-independent protein translocase protein TatA